MDGDRRDELVERPIAAIRLGDRKRIFQPLRSDFLMFFLGLLSFGN